MRRLNKELNLGKMNVVRHLIGWRRQAHTTETTEEKKEKSDEGTEEKREKMLLNVAKKNRHFLDYIFQQCINRN